MTFAQPVWLILLVLLPLLGAGAVVVARLRRKQWSALVAPRLRASLVKRASPVPRWFAFLFLLAACAAAIIGLARPQGDAGIRTEKTLGRNLLVALDLSRSMRVQDVKPDRLSQAKLIIHELLDAMPNERVGIIGFAGSAYLYAPLTVDHRAVRETVDQIDENWVPLGGSDLGAAVRLAVDTLRKTGQKNNALVILSDGEKHQGDLDEMITEAESSGVYILAIGVGSEEGDYVPNPNSPDNRILDQSGKPVISRLHPEVMRRLATETRGRFALAGTGMDITTMVKTAVADLDAFEMEGRERKISIEFYQWLVLPAIVFLMGSVIAGTRWRGVKAALVLAGLCLAPSSARADAVSAAKDALEHKRYGEAGEAYRKLAEATPFPNRRARFFLGAATAAYRGGDFKQARSSFSDALLSSEPAVLAAGHTGMGNTLFQLGWRSLSGDSYPNDPSKAPNLETFDALVRERLSQLKANADPEAGEARGYPLMKSLITNWADAVRHFDSTLAIHPADKAATNRKTTMIYLKRLAELLEEDREKTEQSLPQPQPGEGDPQKGQPKDPQNGEQGDEKSDQSGDQGENDKESKDGSGGDEQEPKEKPGDEKDGDKSDKGPKNPDESPEDRARRILKENADLEKGPLTPGQRLFRNPEKDW